MELKQKLRARMQKIRDSNDVEKMSPRGLLMRRNMNPSERKLAIARIEVEARKNAHPENLNNPDFVRLMNWIASSRK